MTPRVAAVLTGLQQLTFSELIAFASALVEALEDADTSDPKPHEVAQALLLAADRIEQEAVLES